MDTSSYSGLILPISYVLGKLSGLFHARTDDLSVSTYIYSIHRQAIEPHLVGHHRRLVGPGPTRPALGYATATIETLCDNCLTGIKSTRSWAPSAVGST